jgi:hypothetical protein
MSEPQVYVGPAMWPWRGRKWAHLTADTTEALHTFAGRLGLRREWFQSKPGQPWFDHYDVSESKRREAIALGALALDFRQEGRLFLAKRRRLERAG